MANSKSPAFQFYPHDFLGSGKVGTMTVDEVGAYTLLLCLEWNEGGFVYEERDLARFCRISLTKFRKLWPRVSRCFVEREGRWFNPRLDAERAKQQSFRAKQKAKADARWRGDGASRGNAVALPGECSPSPTPSLLQTTSPPARAVVPKKPKEPRPSNWVSRIADEWRGEVGRVSEGQVGAMLKPTHDTHGEHVLTLAMRLWIANQKASGRPCRLAWFADAATQWCHKATAVEAQPVEDGWMSAEMELLTRPKAA